MTDTEAIEPTLTAAATARHAAQTATRLVTLVTAASLFVGAEGLEDAAESRETPQNAVNGREPMPTLDALRGGSRMHVDADAALRAAVKAAVDAGMYERASALLAMLKSA